MKSRHFRPRGLGPVARSGLARLLGGHLKLLCAQLSETGSTPYAVDGVKAMQAFAWYLEQEGTHFSAQEANAHLDARLGKAGFRRDMDTLLRPGLPAFDVDRAGQIVREAYFRHLP